MRGIKTVSGGMALGLMLTLSGCVVLPVDEAWDGYYEPVPYGVPVDGYSYRNPDGLSVVYDSAPGVYVVQEYPGVYWLDNYYYRQRGGYWESSRRHKGPWERYHADNPPFGHRAGYSYGQRATVRYPESARDGHWGHDRAQPRDRGPNHPQDLDWGRNRVSYPDADREERRGWTQNRVPDSRRNWDRRRDQAPATEMPPRQDWKKDSYPRFNDRGKGSRDRDSRPQPNPYRPYSPDLQPVSEQTEIRGQSADPTRNEDQGSGRRARPSMAP